MKKKNNLWSLLAHLITASFTFGLKMKKLSYCIICLLVATSISAKSGVRLKSGNASILGKAVKAFVVFDYSKAEIEGKDMSLEDYIDQKGYKFESKWENAQTMSHKDFLKQFNKKSTGIKLNADSTGREDYKMIIQIRTINLGNTAKSLLPVGARTDGGATLLGRIIINDKAGTNVCVLSFSDIQGLGTVSIEARMMYAYQALKNAIIRYMKNSSVAKAKDEDDDDKDSDEEDEEDDD